MERPQRKYSTLRYVGRVAPRMNLKHKDAPYHMNESVNAKRLSAYRSEMNVIAGDKFVMVEPSIENVNKTILSFDNAKYGDFRDKFFDYGCGFLENQYGDIFKDCIANSEEMAHFVDWTKSAGYTATTYNIMTKGDLIKDPEFLKSDHWLRPWTTVPLVSVANKKELKVKEDVLADKIRLFFISEFHHCYAQVKFGKKSSNRLKNNKWSAYGFSPFHGGTHNLAQKLLSKIIRFYYDVSGWDKFIAIMKDLYKVIDRCTNVPPEQREYFVWMIQHTVEFVSVLWDGDVILKDYGNCSGSGTTTRDNILMHIIIASTFLSEAYFIKMGKLPTYQLLAEQIVKLFGDDSVFAVDEEFSHVLDQKDDVENGFLHQFFRKMGMKLKFLHGGYDYPVDKMEFLGFRFHDINGRYYPYYDPSRLATSFVHTNDKSDTLEAYLSKCFVLTMMSYATEHRDIFINAYAMLLKSIKDSETTDTIRSFQVAGPLTAQILESFYSGLEASSCDFVFFDALLEGGGRNDCFAHFRDDDTTCDTTKCVGETPRHQSP